MNDGSSTPEGAAAVPSPPKERRRLGKTHGRARKEGDPGSRNGGAAAAAAGRREGQGTADSHPLALTPGGPGQGKPRKHTLSIAIPGSVVDNAQNRELKTYLVSALAQPPSAWSVHCRMIVVGNNTGGGLASSRTRASASRIERLRYMTRRYTC